jgi:hypothetical protein
VKFNVIQSNGNRGTQVYLSSCPCKYLFTSINSATFVLDNIKTTTPLDMSLDESALDEIDSEKGDFLSNGIIQSKLKASSVM